MAEKRRCSLSWLLGAVIGINIFTIVQYVSDPDSPTPYDPVFFVFVGVCGVLYLGFILNVAVRQRSAVGLWLVRRLVLWLLPRARRRGRAFSQRPATWWGMNEINGTFIHK